MSKEPWRIDTAREEPSTHEKSRPIVTLSEHKSQTHFPKTEPVSPGSEQPKL